MPAFTASAPGKIILFGEHAVVYGQPAIAAPVAQVQARVVVRAEPVKVPGSVHIQAPEINLEAELEDLPGEHPLATACRILFSKLGIVRPPSLSLRITSTIPVAAGLGSGAAVSVALFRALSHFLGHPLEDEEISSLAFEIEKLHHGTPSGIDNTVITYARPVSFQRVVDENGREIQGEKSRIELLQVPRPFTILIADTGIPSPTGAAVGDVRRAWQAERKRYDRIFKSIGLLAREARKSIEEGEPGTLGPLMDRNHILLQEMDVSSPELDRLVETARSAGASGAKLSGGGRGGNMICLLDEENAEQVGGALQEAGATRTILTTIR